MGNAIRSRLPVVHVTPAMQSAIAARSAARDAIYVAICAASDVASDVASDAARDAEEAWQTEYLRGLLSADHTLEETP